MRNIIFAGLILLAAGLAGCKKPSVTPDPTPTPKPVDSTTVVIPPTSKTVTADILRAPISIMIGVNIRDTTKFQQRFDPDPATSTSDPDNILRKAIADSLVTAMNESTRTFTKLDFVNPNIPDAVLWFNPQKVGKYIVNLSYSGANGVYINFYLPETVTYKYKDGTISSVPLTGHGALTSASGKTKFRQVFVPK